jgi:hypothetical protein
MNEWEVFDSDVVSGERGLKSRFVVNTMSGGLYVLGRLY